MSFYPTAFSPDQPYARTSMYLSVSAPAAQFVVFEILAWYVAGYFGCTVHGLVITAAVLAVAQVAGLPETTDTCGGFWRP